jgi:hypothetical protein
MNMISTKLIAKAFFIYFKYKLRFEYRNKHIAAFNEHSFTQSSPILVIGMHRSGTTIMSSILQEMGVFMGGMNGKGTNEPLLFQSLNDSIFQLARASWDNPAPLLESLEKRESQERITAALRNIIKSSIMNFYKFSFHKKLLFGRSSIWGWKDPRNTFTFKLWLNLFPNMRVIHIYRNGIDVANSLMVRNKAASTMDDISLRTNTMEGCIRIWSEYIDQAALNLKQIDPKNKLEICYESLLLNTDSEVFKIANFLDYTGSIEKVKSVLNHGRAYSFVDNPTLRQEYEKIKNDPIFEKLNYHQL